MKRGYTALEYKSIVRRLRAARPGLSLTSDFIVGFPGETDADFEQTMKLVEDVGFDGAFSFVYSPRPGTPAAELARSRCPPTVDAGAPRTAAGAARRAVSRRAATRWSARAQRVLVTGRVGQGCGRARRRAPRTIASSTSPAMRHRSAATSTSSSPRRCRIRCAASSSPPESLRPRAPSPPSLCHRKLELPIHAATACSPASRS